MSSLNIDIIVPCRIGSRRLPGKPLIRVNEKGDNSMGFG